MNLRILDPADEPLLEAFLAAHRDTSMFLRSNIRRAGIAFRPEPFHAVYVGDFREGRLTGVVAHTWNGMILMQALEDAGELARECVRVSGRSVTGLIGPLDQVKQARAALGLTSSPAAMESDEWLYALDLSELIIPDALSSGLVTCRPPLDGERDTLREWRFNYDVETLGSAASDESRRRSTEYLDVQIAERNAWVAVENNRPVSLSSFNATLPDIVQLGGIYTPPDLRGRGYAKVAVAGSLLVGRERGASRAVLFTSNPSAARSYEALGFRRVGDYGLVLFK
jgi:GNAT superfamily N-acetyltransferase